MTVSIDRWVVLADDYLRFFTDRDIFWCILSDSFSIRLPSLLLTLSDRFESGAVCTVP